jgi:asparagine synthetase B (glutamine-hydrolysing)
MELIDLIDYPALRYTPLSDSEALDQGLSSGRLPPGQYAFALRRGNSIHLARDPVGCNKLFFGRNRDDRLVVGNRIARVWQRGVPLAAMASCPPGHVLEVSSDGVAKLAGQELSDVAADAELSVADLQAESRAALDRAFARLAREFEGCQFAVCLSGGLDSSVVASFAAAHLPGAAAVSFTYLDANDLRRQLQRAPAEQLASASDDFRAAAQVASALGLPLLPVVRPSGAVAGAIRPSVSLGQDWRDFNVHCATVNLFLAQDIRAAFPGRKVVVLTGDLMNEYVCDYQEERVGDVVYYKIPRVPTDRRRKYFVRGLDAGDREIGVFWAYGLVACQPFALLAESYMRVPAAMLDRPDVKWTLNAPLVAPEALPHVSKSKTRAQVGGKDMGTLGIYHQLGIGEAELRRLWREQFPGEPAVACDELIELGRYKLPRYALGR